MLARAGAGASSALRAKIGSSFGIQSHHDGTAVRIFARPGDFLVGRAERRPDVFLGGMKKLPCINARIFVLSSAWPTRYRVCYNRKWNTNQSAKLFLFENSNSRFAQFGFCLICIPAERLFECQRRCGGAIFHLCP